ncbi:DUF192 domain-containing protein [Arvimicrobium flavum]|uniref:DUF192 domain-containing protein n=1 Tax=Arvimicrobium flavum TaxID=3393320 RepID=UPI00237B809E|nr:DUF192 domain-containing protein [Mesorhizobium shangrilense]
MHLEHWRSSGLARCAVLVAFLLGSAATSSADNDALVLPVDPAPLVVESSGGELSFKIEIADDAAERGAGLMFRKFLPADQGMLFVFERTQPVGFWMKNTPLPLDLIFIGEDGEVKAIRQGEPMSEALIAPPESVRFVLELNAGTAAARGIEEGDRLRHPQIEATAGGQGSK